MRVKFALRVLALTGALGSATAFADPPAGATPGTTTATTEATRAPAKKPAVSKSANGKTSTPAAGGAATKPGKGAHSSASKTKKPLLPPHYAEIMHAWHDAPKNAAPTNSDGRVELVLSAINGGEKTILVPERADGGFRAIDLERAAHVLREPGSGNEHPVDPRLLDVVYRLQLHFGAAEIRILSGYRTPKRSGASNHGRGRAMDIVVPGVKDEEVAKYARQVGFVGVGIYPTSGFVHVDVRTRSYFWSDASGPGRKNRERGILGDLAKASDTAALARGDKPSDPYEVSFDVDGAIKAAHAASAAAAATPAPGAADDDDDSDDEQMTD